MDGENKPLEMVSLNQELFSIDADALSVEELEQRLELALAAIPKDFTCGNFDCGGFSCGNFKIPAPVQPAPQQIAGT